MNLLCNRFPIAGSDKICILSRLQCSSTRNLVCYLLWRLLSLACLSLDSCLIVFKSSAVHSHLHLSFFLELCSSVFPKKRIFLDFLLSILTLGYKIVQAHILCFKACFGFLLAHSAFCF